MNITTRLELAELQLASLKEQQKQIEEQIRSRETIISKILQEANQDRQRSFKTAIEEAIELIKADYEANTRLRPSYVFQTLNNAKAKEDEGQINLSKITRVEVVEHSCRHTGRAYTNYNVKDLELSFQDDNRTLKIFLT